MKIVVIGGTGLIGQQARRPAARARPRGRRGVALIGRQHPHRRGPGRGAARAPHVVVDVANSPSFEDKAVLEFFETSGRNLLAAEAAAGVQHHVALSVVGTDRLPGSGYFRAKIAQEKLIKAGDDSLHDRAGDAVLRVPRRHRAVGHRGRHGPPVAGARCSRSRRTTWPRPWPTSRWARRSTASVEIAGPERVRMAELVQRYLAPPGSAHGRGRPAGALLRRRLDDQSLMPGGTRASARSPWKPGWRN